MSTLILGMPQSGKSTSELPEVQRRWRRNRDKGLKVGTLVIDPHGTFVENLGAIAVADGFAKEVWWDCAGDYEALGYDLPFHPCDNPLDEERMVDAFVQTALVKRNFKDSYDHAYYEKYLPWAFKLVLRQNKGLRALKYALRWPDYGGLLEGADREIREEYARFNNLSKSTIEREMSPADRVLCSMVDNVTVGSRLDGLFPFIDFLKNGGKFFLSGRGASPDKFRTLGSILSVCAAKAVMEDDDFFLDIWIDEANRGFISAWIADLLEQIEKFGCQITLMCQSNDWPEAYKATVVQAATRTILYRCREPDILRYAAGILIGELERHKVHHVEEAYRDIRGPIERYERISRSKSSNGKFGEDRHSTEGYTISEAERQIWTTILERTPVYESPGDQSVWLQQAIAALANGERYVVDQYGTRKQYVHKVKEPLMPCMPGLAQKRFKDLVARLQSLSYFRNVSDYQCRPETVGAAKRHGRTEET